MPSLASIDDVAAIFEKMVVWYDPQDEEAMRKRGSVVIPGSSGVPGTAANCYLQATNANGFNGGDGAGGYATRTELSLSFWIKHNAQNATNTLNRHIVAKGYTGATTSGGSWAISTGDNFNEEEFIAIWLWTNGTTGIVAANNTNQGMTVLDRWYHVVIVIDLAESTDALRARMWIDGVEATMGTWSGTMPAGLQNSTTDLFVGRRMFDGHNDFGGNVSDVYLWSRALTPTQAASLWNSGQGRYIDDTDWASEGLDAQLEGAWAMNETSGNRLDASGNSRHFVPGGANVGNMSYEIECRALLNKADRIWDESPARRFWIGWGATLFNGHPGFDLNQHMVSGLGTTPRRVQRLLADPSDWPGPTREATGGLIAAWYSSSSMNTESTIFTSSNSLDDDSYLIFMMFRPTTGSPLRLAVRMNATDEGLDANWFGQDAGIAVNNHYVVNWSWGGVAASVISRVNGAVQTVSYPAVASPADGSESWPSIAARDNYSFGAWLRSTGDQSNGTTRCGGIMVFGPQLTANQSRLAEYWLASKVGIDVGTIPGEVGLNPGIQALNAGIAT